MKKIGYWLATVALAVICVCALVACGGVEGTYKLYSMKMGNKEIKMGEEFSIGLGSIKLSEDLMTLELKSDGTAVMTVKMGGEGMTEEGTWKTNEEDKTKVDITFDGDTETATIDGGTLVMGYEGMGTVTLKK